jgi:hypothetical protein
VPRHGSGRPLHLSQLGSTPHDRVTSPQIRSSHSLPLDRPRQDASRHPPVVTNRPTTYRVRREPPLIQQPIHHPPACSSASTPFTHFIRGTQIPIAQDATPTSPSRGFLPWRFAYAGPPVHAAPPSWVRHPQTFTIGDSDQTSSWVRKVQFGSRRSSIVPTGRSAPWDHIYSTGRKGASLLAATLAARATWAAS